VESSGVVALIVTHLNPSGIGDRLNTIGALFQRFRVNRVRCYFKSAYPTSNGGSLTMGVIDDVGEATTVTTADQIMNLRVKAEGKKYSNFGVSWSPLDKSKWYYTAPDNSNDDRFQTPGTFVMISDIPYTTNSGNVGALFIDYDVEFAGRTLIAV
jgi:hypothetical protein